MAYTPTNWQTGDTITAEKLNNLESGVDNAQWKSEESTQLFSETVTTTEEGDGGNTALLSYAEHITADELTVTFDGVEYTCPRMQHEGFNVYGSFSQTGPDFSEYPFMLTSGEFDNKIYNDIHTETAGEHTISATAKEVSYSSAFTQAVSDSLASLFVVLGELDDLSGTVTLDKTFDEIRTAVENAQNIVMFMNSKLYTLVVFSTTNIKFNHCYTITNNGQQSLNGETVTINSDNTTGITYESFNITSAN